MVPVDVKNVPEEFKQAVEAAVRKVVDDMDHLHILLTQVDNKDFNLMHGRLHSAQDDMMEIAGELGINMNPIGVIVESGPDEPKTKH